MDWPKKSTGRDQSVGKFLEDIRRHRAMLVGRAGQLIRQNRVASAVAGLVLISLLGGVIQSTWLAHRAKPAKTRAENASNKVRKLAHFRPVDSHGHDLAGATRIRESQMTDAPRPDVRQDIAYVNNGTGSAMEGDRKASVGAAAPTYDEVVADNSRDRAYRLTFPAAYPNSGGAIFLTGVDPARLNLNKVETLAFIKQRQAALVAFQNQLALDEKSVAADPGNVQVQNDLVYSSSRVGDLLTDVGDQAGALSYYQRAVDVYARNAATGPQDPAVSLHLTVLLWKLAKTYARLGYTDKAIAECNKAVDLLEAIPADLAQVEQLQSRALVYGEIADVYSLLAGDARTPQELTKELWRAARDTYERSLEILRALRDRGVLDAEELTEIDTIVQKIAECDVFLAK